MTRNAIAIPSRTSEPVWCSSLMDVAQFLKRTVAEGEQAACADNIGRAVEAELSSAIAEDHNLAPSVTVCRDVAPSSQGEALVGGVTRYRDVTPAGLVIEYTPEQYLDGKKVKRSYTVDGVEVPSVTTVLDCLRKDGLSWWGMKVGVEGVIKLIHESKIAAGIDWVTGKPVLSIQEPALDLANVDNVTKLLTENKLTVNHALNRAGDRGTNVHKALEDWAHSGGEFFPTPENFPEEEQPYVRALLQWVDTLDGAAKIKGVEVMVGSAEHGFAGRFDLLFELWETREFVTKAYKRKDDLMLSLAPGLYRLDAKTSSGCYTSHHLQLAGYEVSSIECGYEPVDGGLILRLDKSGVYELVPSKASGADFLAVKSAYDRLEKLP